jgi:hypothetical protein
MPKIQTQFGLPSRMAPDNSNIPGGWAAELLESRLMPDYHALLKAGLVYSGSIVAANPAAFVGGAAGTPLMGLFNPVGSGKDLVLLDAVIGVRTTGTAIASEDFNHWAGNQGGVAVTGANTPPINLYSQAAAGSVATFMANVVNTGALASKLIRPSLSLGAVAAAAALNVGLLRDEIKGGIVIAPGVYYAFAASAALTAGSIDAALIWAEVPAT